MLFSALNDWMNNDTDSDSLSATHRRQATSPTFLGIVEQMSFEHGRQHFILYLAPSRKIKWDYECLILGYLMKGRIIDIIQEWKDKS